MVKEAHSKIEAMAFKGYGITHIDGKVVFVPFSLTRDEVLIEIVDEKSRFSIGILKELLKPSPWRISPQCHLFGRCGGCQWQHIDDSIQVDLKKEILVEILQRLGRMKDLPPISVIKSSNPYGYRTRIQLKMMGNRIGFFEMRSHHIVEIDQCPISHPIINQILNMVRKELKIFSGAHGIEINISPDELKGILIIKNLNLDPKVKDRLSIILKDVPILKGIVIEKKGKSIFLDNPYIHYKIRLPKEIGEKEITFRVSPGSFYQVNLEENKKLVETVLKFSEIDHKEIVLDLYSGIGNFTLPLSYLAKEAIGVEVNRTTFEDACFNVKQNGIKNCDFIYEDVEKVLREKILKKPNLVILDPPRAGCKRVIDELIQIKPPKIIYVSCEPTTLARDLRIFNEKGYAVTKLSLIDMFPQTYHMEVVALLKSLY